VAWLLFSLFEVSSIKAPRDLRANLIYSISMCLRRPNLVRWSKYMDECIEVLETSDLALPSDKILCQHVLLQHINEEIGNQFCMDDPSAPVSITDAKVQMSVKAFERALDDWTLAVPKKLFVRKYTSVLIPES